MNPNILSVIMYGSHARKDNDNSSDLDICVITKKNVDQEINQSELSSLTTILKNKQIEITTYSHETIQSMLKYGSLFLWHLKEEGVVLYGQDYFNKILKRLSPYHHHVQELEYHQKILHDLQKVYEVTKTPNEHDLSLLFTICRNTCMILSNKYDVCKFGRFSCYTSAKKLFKKLPIPFDTYKYLSEWKNIYERNISVTISIPNNDYYEDIMLRVESLLNFALDKICQHD